MVVTLVADIDQLQTVRSAGRLHDNARVISVPLTIVNTSHAADDTENGAYGIISLDRPVIEERINEEYEANPLSRAAKHWLG